MTSRGGMIVMLARGSIDRKRQTYLQHGIEVVWCLGTNQKRIAAEWKTSYRQHPLKLDANVGLLIAHYLAYSSA